MYYPFSWFKSIVRLCLFLIVFALVGWYLDDMLLAVALGATGLLLLTAIGKWSVGTYLRRDLLPAAPQP